MYQMNLSYNMTRQEGNSIPTQNWGDSEKDRNLRQQLVEEIRRKGISNRKVLHAVNEVPRHLFMPDDLESFSYEDKAFPIGEGQTISQPYTVAYQTQLLEVRPNDKVLEIGTGSMYQACILAAMGAEVFTIERQKKLFSRKSVAAYVTACKNIRRFYGDGYDGLPEHAPFDKIIITAAAPFIPSGLVQQLKPGGIMVLPVGTGTHQTMIRLSKHKNGDVSTDHFDSFSFVPMLKGKSE